MLKKYFDKKVRLSLEGRTLYFLSDLHLGSPGPDASRLREKRVIQRIQDTQEGSAAYFFLGDTFDFWFEYRHAVPKGYIRFLGKIAELTDNDIPVFFFSGNHDKWVGKYLEEELGAHVILNNLQLETESAKFLVGHGDGLGPGDFFYKNLIKPVFENKFNQRLFRWLHPDLGIGLANAWSRRSRISSNKDEELKPLEQEWLYQYCRQVEEMEHHDYYIFGHRHLVINEKLTDNSIYINLGEWVNRGVVAAYNEASKMQFWEVNPKS